MSPDTVVAAVTRKCRGAGVSICFQGTERTRDRKRTFNIILDASNEFKQRCTPAQKSCNEFSVTENSLSAIKFGIKIVLFAWKIYLVPF